MQASVAIQSRTRAVAKSSKRWLGPWYGPVTAVPSNSGGTYLLCARHATLPALQGRCYTRWETALSVLCVLGQQSAVACIGERRRADIMRMGESDCPLWTTASILKATWQRPWPEVAIQLQHAHTMPCAMPVRACQLARHLPLSHVHHAADGAILVASAFLLPSTPS